MKTAEHKAPKIVVRGFFISEIIVIVLGSPLAFTVNLADTRPLLGWVYLCALAILFLMSCFLVARERYLALSGFALIVLAIIIGIKIPAF